MQVATEAMLLLAVEFTVGFAVRLPDRPLLLLYREPSQLGTLPDGPRPCFPRGGEICRPNDALRTGAKIPELIRIEVEKDSDLFDEVLSLVRGLTSSQSPVCTENPIRACLSEESAKLPR